MHVHMYVFVFVHTFTYMRTHRAQWRFSVVPRPFKQAKEILRRAYPRPHTFPVRQRWRVKP